MNEAAASLVADDGVPLKLKLRRAERAHKLKSVAMIAPLFLFLLLSFVLPIGTLMYRSVDNPELHRALPQTVAALAGWDAKALPDEPVFAALVRDLRKAQEESTLGLASRRLNYEISGFSSLLTKLVRKLPPDGAGVRDAVIAVDERWGQLTYWRAIARAGTPLTSFYLLKAVDHRVNEAGDIESVPANEAAYVTVFGRTFWIALIVTLWALALGFPVAYLLATLPSGPSNLLMILVLLPFWTSLLVRTAAWIVLLQSGGILNGAMIGLGLIAEPLQLVFNRFGVYVAMVHILLPFMILPLYSVMKGISPAYVRAAVSLGAHPFVAFWRVYVPQTIAGVAAGCLLVFILAIGYYITPALVGGPDDQMVSYFVAFFTNRTINWGMASALGTLLLIATLVLYAVYGKLVSSDANKARR